MGTSATIHEMVVETVRPGTLPRLVESFGGAGARLRASRGCALRGAWTSEFGALNKLYSLWEFPSERDRQAANAALESSAPWRDYARAVAPLVVDVRQLVMRPARLPGSTAPAGGIFDFRMYDVVPYRADEYIAALLDVMPTRERHSSAFGVWRQVSGSVDRIVHLWPYRDLAHRAEVRAAVAREDAWQEFLKKAFGMLVAQRSSLLRAVDGIRVG